MSSFIFDAAKTMILKDGTIDLSSGVVKAMLVDSSCTASSGNTYVSDIGTLGELSGTGYASGFSGSGRKTLSTKTVTTNSGSHRGEFKADNVTWSAINAGTAAACILYIHDTSDAASRVIAYIDSGGFPVTTNGGDLTVSWNANGIIQAT